MIKIQDIIPFMKDGWVAMDEDGKWCFFNYLPTIYKGKFGNMLDRVELYRGFDIAPANDWTKSLICIKGKNNE